MQDEHFYNKLHSALYKAEVPNMSQPATKRRIIAYLWENGKTRHQTLEDELDLSQPVANTNLNQMRGDAGPYKLVTADKVKTEGKGRPHKLYYLTSDWYKHILTEVDVHLDKLKAAYSEIARLKTEGPK